MIAKLAKEDAERSFTDSSDDQSDDPNNGMIIYMQIWLGDEIGHKPL
jgi:hypothetical protein